ncbi:MAG: hypothetical protein ACXWF8_12745 [Methylobacter sp.]
MKNVNIYKIICLGLAILSYSQETLSHSQSGALADNPNQLLGNTAGTVDYYQVTCSTDSSGTAPDGLITRIRDLTPGALPKVSVHAQKDGATMQGYIASTSTDETDNDANFSSWGVVVGGPGVYTVLVTKEGNGNETYNMEAHCMTYGGVETGTDLLLIQDQ